MAYERVLAAFPRRALVLTKSRRPFFAQLFAILGGLLLGGLGVAIPYNYLPAILDDMAVAQGGTAVPGSWGGWHCTIHRGVIADCTVEVHYSSGSKQNQFRSIPMLMFGRPDRDTPIAAIVDRNNPDRVGTSLGESYLTDRWIMLGVATAFFLLTGLACFWGALSTRRTGQVRRALAASPNPTIVHLDKVQRVKSASTWTFSWTAGVTRFARKDTLVKPREPLLVDPTTGSAVALTDARGGAMLLDSRLIDLQLTDAERQAVFDAVQREQPRAAPVPAAPAGAAAIRR